MAKANNQPKVGNIVTVKVRERIFNHSLEFLNGAFIVKVEECGSPDCKSFCSRKTATLYGTNFVSYGRGWCVGNPRLFILNADEDKETQTNVVEDMPSR